MPEIEAAHPDIQAVIATTGQGRQLTSDANILTVSINQPFEALEDSDAILIRGDNEKSEVPWDQDLHLTVLCPGEKRLKSLQKQWDEDLRFYWTEVMTQLLLHQFLGGILRLLTYQALCVWRKWTIKQYC
ncbi:MAG: hypothetical protein WDO19_30225 [Bacteroidota bacterium]